MLNHFLFLFLSISSLVAAKLDTNYKAKWLNPIKRVQRYNSNYKKNIQIDENLEGSGVHLDTEDSICGLGCLRPQVSSDVQDIRTNSFSFSGSSHDQNPPEAKKEVLFDEDGFCGFLAIGTLGADPETPKFSALVAEEDELEEKKEMEKLITEKLNKFLEEYPKDISSMEVERSNSTRDRESNVCPLQDYDLFRSSTELTNGNNGGAAKKKKSLLTSIFKRRQTVQGESYKEKHGTSDVIKRVFKTLHGTSSKIRNDDYDDMLKTKKDIRKIVQNFRSKVHPVLYTPPRDDHKVDNRRKLDLKVPDLLFTSSSISEENRKRENWIKTDTEYLVLEL